MENNNCPQFHLVVEQTAQALRDQQELLQDTFTELARLRSADELHPEKKKHIEETIQSLRKSASMLKDMQQKTASLADELSARLIDSETSINRKWYKLNPPSNGSIDLVEKEKKHFAQGLNIYKMFLILIVGSFMGVVVELLWCFAKYGYLESRSGLVYGPFNLVYGAGAMALSAALYRFRNRGKWLSFLGGMAIGSIVEYFCSWFQEMLFGSTSWDYSQHPFNLNGRICLLYSVFWGVLGVLWIKDIYPRMSKWILKLPNRLGKCITWVLVLFMVFNACVSAVSVARWSERIDGLPPEHALDEFLDERFPDERMERIYANMVFE